MLKTLSLSPDAAQEDPQDDQADPAEARMRRALGMLSSRPEPRDTREPGGFAQRDQSRADHGAARRHRFVKDGEVPVVHMPVPRRDGLPAPAHRADPPPPDLQPLLAQERQARERAERALAETQTQLRVIQTKLAHTEMALNDAAAAAETRSREIAALHEALATARALLPAPEPAAAPRLAAPTPPPPLHLSSEPPALRRRPGRPRIHPMPAQEPEPVQWWLDPAPRPRGRPIRS